MVQYTAGQRIRGSEINALPQLYRVTTDQTNSTASFADVVGLAFTGEVSGLYLVECFLIYKSPAARDIRFQWVVPSGTTGWWAANGNEAGSSTVGQTNRQTLAIQTPGVHAFAGDDALESNVTPWAYVALGGVAGTVKLQQSQLSAGTGPTLVRAGSSIRVSRLG
jgi:hypothetical protein